MPENYILLERTELNASAASVTFANIPQTGYTDLKVVVSGRCDATQGVSNVYFNGLTTNLSSRIIYGIGSGTPGSATYASNIRSGYIVGTAYTASTFANNEIYIPNYTSSNFKSVSIDSVTETNATEAYCQLVAGLWSSTSAITSITLEVISNVNGTAANFVSGSTFSLYGIAAVGTTPAIAPKASGGNIIDYDGTYWIHTFLTSGTFTPQTPLNCDYLVVAGGGGALTSDIGGGGGAGGFRTGSGYSILNSTVVTVGAGGSSGTNGANSVFDTITSTGGGRGGARGGANEAGSSGGSGGGSGTNGTAAVIISGGAASPSGQGNTGGSSYGGGTTSGSGGGGGAGSAGGNGGNGTVGAGGNGLASSISGTSVTYAGGGGGGNAYISGGAGGSGGGGAGGSSSSIAQNGTTNRGAGGGGGGNASNSYLGGNGGSGIVIIRYPAA